MNRTRTIAILVRAHGGIHTNIDNTIQINEDQLLPLVDMKRFSHLNRQFQVVNVSLSKLGGVCYGSPNIQPFINSVNTWYREHPTDIDNKIVEIFGPNPPEGIKSTLERVTGISFSPVITPNTDDLYLNKHYTKFDNKSGIFILASENINMVNLEMIKAGLDGLNHKIQNNEKVSKVDILNIVSSYIDKLYFIDFTCSAYINDLSMPQLTDPYVVWMNDVFNHKNIMGGGKTKKSKNKTRINRSRRNNNKTRINRINLAKKKRSSRR